MRSGAAWRLSRVAVTAAALTASVLVAQPALAAGSSGPAGSAANGVASRSAPNSEGTAAKPPVSPASSTPLTAMEAGYGATTAQKAAMAQATAQARTSGKAVAVGALTTETWQVVAQPAGGFILAANTEPVRTRKQGGWVPVDTTLSHDADGTLSPAATAYGSVTFSGGGSVPLAVTSSGSVTYAISWPGPLPAPTVSGSTATYANVLPSVDLVVSATVSGGFSDVLVVKNAAAAKNPKLRTLTLTTRVSGGRIAAAQAANGLAVSGAPNGNVLESASPVMWDSNTALPSVAPKAAPGAKAATGAQAAAVKAGPDRSDAGHPGAAARTAAVGLRAGGSTLTLSPDTSLLDSPSAVFPLYIDPTLNWHPAGGGTAAFDEVKQDSPCNGASYYNNSGSNADYGQLGVGVSWWGGCEGIQRAYYQWQLPHVIWGADIHLATVNATEVWQASWSCSESRTVNLHWSGGIGGGTDYNNQPGPHNGTGGWLGYSTSTSVGAAYNASGCTNPSSSPAGFTVTSPIAQSASAHSTQFTVALTQDGNESSGADVPFDRFADNPTLNIQYNLRPNTPGASDLSAVSGSANAGCATATPYPYMGKTIASNTPVLDAHISDPDGDTLQAQYQYWVDGSSTVATASSGDNLASGSKATYSLPASFISSLSNGQTVDWQVRVTDGGPYTGWSPTCHFTAYPTGPDAPSIPANATYPNIDNGGGTGAAAGTSATFTLNGATNGAAATKFIYNVDQPPATSGTPASQTAAVTGTAAATPADRWKLTDATGSTGADSAGTLPVTLTNATWTTDATRGTVLATNGTTAYAASAAPALNTTTSYSVSAWAYLTSSANFATFASQAGAVGSAFYLQYSHSTNAWAFVIQDADTTTSTQTSVHGSSAPSLNTWTHLVGVYDAAAKTASLYVNGTLIGTSAVAATFNAAGPLVIGAVKTTGGTVSNQVPGKISDVQTYARALTATEANAMYASADVSITPLAAGPHTLYAAALDAAGDVSGFQTYKFLAAGHAGNSCTTNCPTLSSLFNNTAISPDANMAAGAADGYNSISATDLTTAGWTSGGGVTVNGARLTLPAFGSGQADNVLAANQTVAYSYPVAPSGASSLVFLATSTTANLSDPGSISGDTTAPYVPQGTGVSGVYCFDSTNPSAYCPALGTITYIDGTTQSYYLTVPDWISGPSTLAAVTLPHENRPSGQITTNNPKLYPFSVPLQAGKTVQSITLPDVSSTAGVPALHIFSIGARNTTDGTVEANGTNSAAAADYSWTGAWAAPTEGNYNFLGSNFNNQTFRVAVKPSISGGTIRVKLDDALGTSPITIGAATVALDATSGGVPTAAPSGSFSTLTFGGTGVTSTTIPEGGMVFSDPLPFTATQNQWLLVSFQISNSIPYLVQHSFANTAFEWITPANSGNDTTLTATSAFTGTAYGWFTDLLTGLDVQTTGVTVTTSTPTCTISSTVTSCTTGVPTQAVLGDGLIDAWQPNTQPLSTNTALRLSDDLAATEPTTPTPYGTIAAGIESNQIMKDYPQTEPGTGNLVGGPSALARIDRDILDEPGINTVVLFQGLEDLLNRQTAANLDGNGYSELISYLSASATSTAGFINTDAVGLTPCDGYTGDAASGNSTNDPCTSTVDGYRTTVNGWLNGNNSLGLSAWSSPAMYYVNSDNALGVTQPNGEVKLNSSAAIGTSNGNTIPDAANLTLSGYGALASAILGPQDTWQLNDGNINSAASAANDSAANTSAYLMNNPAVGQGSLALNGGYTWVNDPSRGYALHLDGATGYGASSSAVLNTAGSFTVSAWVDLASVPTNTATVFSQEGANNSGFYLWYNTGSKGWAFSFASNDTTSYTLNTAGSSAGTATNAWTHVVGVYNAATHAAQLYVNGSLAASGSGITNWNATGPLLLGAAKTGGTLGNYFPGTISGAAAWNYALTGAQVSALYQQISGLPSTTAIPSGYETGQTRSAGTSGTWSGATQAATIPGASAVSSAGMPNGDTAVVTLAGGQEYLQWHYAADGSWSPVQVVDTRNNAGALFANITAVAATASTSSDGTGMLQILSVAGGTEHHQTWTAAGGWTTFEVPPGSGSSVTAVAAAGFKDGTAQFMSVIGGVEYHQIRNANGTWTAFNKLGNSGVTAVAAAAMSDGTAQFMSVVGGAVYNQARYTSAGWSAFNQVGSYTGATAVAAAPDADNTAQFLILTGTTENWIMGNWTTSTWTANAVVNTGVSAVAIAGYNGATTTNAWYGTTQGITIS
jgi:hypothetical protein